MKISIVSLLTQNKMKTVKLTPCNESKFPDIPDLKFYRTEDELYYFDAENYLGRSDPPSGRSIEEFLATFDFQISAIADGNGIPPEDVLVANDSGDKFLEECLFVPFLTYVDPGLGPYLVLRLEELLRFGFTINDNMAQYFYKTRFED